MKRAMMMATAALLLAGTAMAQEAAVTYKAKCAMCHGADGKGNAAMAKSMQNLDLTADSVQKMSEADLAATISNGKGKMPSYKAQLKPEQISGLAKFVKTLKK